MTELVQKAESFIFRLFKEELPGIYLYHNYLHTNRVVESVEEIIEHTKMPENDKEAVLIAAWFHDSGYISGYKNHEEKSVEIAEDFLNKENAPRELIDKVSRCILITKNGSQPSDLIEEIMRDADSSHLAKDYYQDVSELLRQELNLQGIASYDAKEWRNENVKLFTEEHKFYTEYARLHWSHKKNEHLIDLLKEDRKGKKKRKKEELKAKLKAKYKNESPERGIQTLYRVTLRNHIKLSDIADTKANILLSVNAIIISLALANLIPKLDAPSNKHLLIPSLILVLFSVASIILSIMSTQPNITGGEFTQEQVDKKKINLLFFGNFYKMPYEKYQNAIDQVIEDKEYVYKMLTKDLYFLGVVLKRKYTLLQITYIVFTIGIILSVIAFIIAFWGMEWVEEVSKTEIIK